MAENTITRKALRRAIAAELQMPFFRRFPAGELTIDATSTTTSIVDASLRQNDGFWNGHWFYGLVAGDTSLIRNYTFASHALALETAMASTPSAGDKYEIHTVWNAAELHAAINRSINMVGRIFPETLVDETLVLQENLLSYTISSLTKKPFRVNKVFMENPATVYRGVATAGGASTITVESIPSGIDTNWKVSIYAGTGTGQIRSYLSSVGNAITVNSAWTTTPDSTSKYALWDTLDQQNDWVQTRTVYTDAKEYPDVLRFQTLYSNHYGLRIRIEYIAVSSELSTDSDTTVVPSEYIIPKACSLLHGQKLKDTRSDRDMHFAENQRYEQQADRYLVQNAPHLPDTQIPAALSAQQGYDAEDPLNWNNWR